MNAGTETKVGKCDEIMTSNPNIAGIREIRSDTERISASYGFNEMELLEEPPSSETQADTVDFGSRAET